MTHIEQRHDTAAGWAAANPVLRDGERGHEKNTRKSKTGDGVTPWNDLGYEISGFNATKADVGLSEAENTSDEDKPISVATQAALDALAPKASPTFTGNPTAPTPATPDNDTSVATTAFVKNALAAALADPAFAEGIVGATVSAAIEAAALSQNPVGSIKMTTTNVNPSNYIGGTWAAWGSGRVPVGVDASQSEFDGVEETGGAKTHTLTTAEIPSHTHGLTSLKYAGGGANTPLVQTTGAPANPGLAQRTDATGGGEAHNNLQPYITCFMWKRTA